MNYELIYNDLSIKNYKNRLIFIISILHFIGLGSDLIFYLIFVEKTLVIEQIEWLISIEIIARIIFCKFLLKMKLFRHHIFSILISMTGFLFMGITGLIKIVKNNACEKKGYYILFTIFSEIAFSLEDVICKILLTDKFMLPHILMFWRGIIIFLIFIILVPILHATDTVQLNHYYNFIKGNNLSLYIFLKILLIIFSFSKGFITMKVIDIFTPQHVAFLNIVFSLVEFIKYIISPDEDNSIDLVPDIFDIFFLIVIIIGTLIFNEMIIINKFGFNEDTKSGLLLKEKIEEDNELNSSISSNEEDLHQSNISEGQDHLDNSQRNSEI